jgi:hypothetical protein
MKQSFLTQKAVDTLTSSMLNSLAPDCQISILLL